MDTALPFGNMGNVMDATRWIRGLAIAHLAVLAVHAAAHLGLGVMPPTVADYLYINAIIYLAPVAALLLLRRYPLAAAWLLLVTALGSLVYGGWHHYLVVSPDHVDHLPPGPWGTAFRLTALVSIPVDALAALVAARALLYKRR